MPSWLLQLADAVIGAVVGFAAGWAIADRQARHGRQAADRDERREWRREGAAVSAEIQADVLDELIPESLKDLKPESRFAAYMRALESWGASSRELRRVGTGHPDNRVLSACLQAERAVEDVMDAGLAAIGEAMPVAELTVEAVVQRLVDGARGEGSSPPTEEEIREAWNRLAAARDGAYRELEALRVAMHDPEE